MNAPATACYAGVDGDAERVAADLAGCLPSGKIILAEYCFDAPEMRILGFVPEPHFLAIRQEDERYIELVGVALPLCLTCAQIDAGALCLQHGKRPARSVKQRIVRRPTIIERILEANATTIRKRPACILQDLIDLYPCECFIRHSLRPPSKILTCD